MKTQILSPRWERTGLDLGRSFPVSVGHLAQSHSKHRHPAADWLATLALGLNLVLCARALPPVEPEDGSPVPPCADLNIAVGQAVLELLDLPLRGCTVNLSAGGSKISVLRDLCHDPLYYDLPSSTPISWQLVSWPGSPAPSFSFNSTMASLALPRTGTYRVRFTICPSDDCSFRPRLGGQSYPLRTASTEITIVAVDAVAIPVEKYPVLPTSANAATQPTDFPDKNCRCQGGGGAVDPQWVTTTDFNGPEDYGFVEGAVTKSWISTKDNPLNHHSQDVNFGVRVDPAFRRFLSTEPEFADPFQLGVEWERGSFPERFRPTYGDRVSVFGYWILDCGHPPFYTEIHPAVGVAVHRPRPVALPSGRTFLFSFADGDVLATVGNNVFVPGILTDIWFNRNSGEATSNCSSTGLHQPGECFVCNPPQPNCPPWIGGPCLRGPAPLNRVFEFNIYLPRDPRVSAQAQGVNPPAAPLYFEISNPWNHGGPDPVITRQTEGSVTYLRVRIDLRSFSGNTYSRRVASAWVYPAPDNWGLNRWRVSFEKLDVHDDHDPWTDWPNDDGDWRLWFITNNRDQEWTRILDGDDNAHGTMNFNPPWQTGSPDPVFWRSLGSLDSLRRLGPDVLAYPDQRVAIAVTAFEDDWIQSDDPGRIATSVQGERTFMFRSSKGSYTVHGRVQAGPAVGAASLSAAADRLYRAYSRTCFSGPLVGTVRPQVVHPLEAAGFFVPGVAATPPWTVQSDAQIAQLGTAVAGVGDINGDGYSDVLVGAPRFGGRERDGGKAYLYLGYAEQMATEPWWAVEGDQLGGLVGASVAGGDVNGDGFADLLIGAPGYGEAPANGGAVFLWLGGALPQDLAATPGTANFIEQENIFRAGFGTAVASAGDINGDGFDDVLVGAPFLTNVAGADLQGRVTVFLGSSNGLVRPPHRNLFPPIFIERSEHWFGFSVAGAGDVNNDGFDDVIIGAPRYSNGRANEGAAFVYYGSAEGLNPFPDWSRESGRFGAKFGHAVASAGDVNGDGFDDVLIGAPGYESDDVVNDEGGVYLYLGSAGGLQPGFAWFRSAGFGGAQFGSSVAGVGDLDADGLDDVVIGGPYAVSQDQAQAGRFWVYRGTNAPTGLSSTPTWVQGGPHAGALLGWAVAPARDVNADGFADYVVGTPGFSDGENAEGSVAIHLGAGPREIQLVETRFFRAQGPEQFALFNVFESDFQKLLDDSGQSDPAKLEVLLAELRQELMDETVGTARYTDALAELQDLADVIPTALWEQYLGDVPLVTGGALLLDCGGTNETVDAWGRRWKPDAPFLVSAGGNVAQFNDQPVDVSLLSDTAVPNNVILSERWRSGDLLYEVAVNNGLHTVILYFSENCPGCVNTNLGGTGPAETARIFDLEVEGQRVDAYNQADAAVPPANDGIGATFKATQVVFRDVMVTDGGLNIGILDRGPGNPPENAAIKALAILQKPAADGVIAPRIVAIRPVENFFQITVDPGPNFAAYLAGLVAFALEESADLNTWEDAGVSPTVFNNRVYFEFPPEDSAHFYRVVVQNVIP